MVQQREASQGEQLYRQTINWTQSMRTRLTQVLNRTKTRTTLPSDLKRPLAIMRELMEIEGELIGLRQIPMDMSEWVTDQLELELRGIRDTLGRMVADAIANRIYFEGDKPEEYGITYGDLGEGRSGFYIDLPYELIAMSDLFLVRSKKLAVADLITVRQAWIVLVKMIADQLKAQGNSYPIEKASIRVTITIKHHRPLDPDHFWLRPILDGLVENRILIKSFFVCKFVPRQF